MNPRDKKNQIQAPNVFIPGRTKLIQFWGEVPGEDEEDTWCSCCAARNRPVAHVGLPESNKHVAICG